jgi:hypothetical protein
MILKREKKMERNDIALIRRWAEEISKDEATGLEIKLSGSLETMNELINEMGLEVKSLKGAVRDIKKDAEVTSKDFAAMKEGMAKKPRTKKPTKVVEKAIKPKYKTR